MRLSATDLSDDQMCFVCGSKNTLGLRMDWKSNGKETVAEFVAPKHLQGWKDILHGGIIATLLDEAMTRLIWEHVGPAVTAEMTVRYLAPAMIGEKFTVRGEIVDASKKLVSAKAEMIREDGVAVARAEGKTIRLSR
ncbi:MAG TPA: PaaI family thioesterase [Elusimicrobiota bacterium]|nr:PaaI family thioesterase [Elusimicrobiota bacterium]